MIEKLIDLESIDIAAFLGVKNCNLEIIKNRFPKIKIITRGDWLKAIGEAEEVTLFEEKMSLLLEHFREYNVLSESDVDNIVSGSGSTKRKKTTDTILYGVNGKAIKARTKNQKRLVEAFVNNDLLFAVGPAGTGKTYTAIALAVKALKARQVRRIILSRPAVEAGEKLGFLPGDMKDKIDPYLQPLYDALQDMIHGAKLKDYLENGTIQIAPLAYMRGRTLNNAFVILDEAQNTTTNQLKMFLTRMGADAKFVVTGDITQIDLPKAQHSGLVHAMKILTNIKGIKQIEFDVNDIVRHKLVQDIVEAYDKRDRAKAGF